MGSGSEWMDEFFHGVVGVLIKNTCPLSYWCFLGVLIYMSGVCSLECRPSALVPHDKLSVTPLHVVTFCHCLHKHLHANHCIPSQTHLLCRPKQTYKYPYVQVIYFLCWCQENRGDTNYAIVYSVFLLSDIAHVSVIFNLTHLQSWNK